MEGELVRENTSENKLKTILESIIFIIGTFALMILMTFGLKKLDIQNKYISKTIPRILVAIGCAYFFKKKYQGVTMGMGKPTLKLGLGIILSWPMFIAIIINMSDVLGPMNWKTTVMPSLIDWITYTLYVIAIGVFEEVIVRGIILNKMLIRWGNTKSGIYSAIIISSLLFGLWHMINLINKPWLIVATITQVIYTFCLGFYFASVYLRTKNLWIVILMHGLYDFSGELSTLFMTTPVAQGVKILDISVISGMMTIVPFIGFIVIALFYLRKIFNQSYMYQPSQKIEANK